MKLFNDVRPGDLITAAQINQVMWEIEKLAGRVERLEAGQVEAQPPVITGVSSPEGLLRVGDIITVHGRGFGSPAENQVSIGGSPIRGFEQESGETALVFMIPGMVVPEAGTRMTITVSNRRGFAATEVTVFPANLTRPEGFLSANLTNGPANTLIEAGGKYAFTFTVRGTHLTLPETYNLRPTIDRPGWKADVVDDRGDPVDSPSLSLAAGTTSGQVTVRVSVDPNAKAGDEGTLRLGVESRRNRELNGTSGGDVLRVRDYAPTGQDDIVPRLVSLTGPGDRTVAISGVALIPPHSEFSTLSGSVRFKVSGTYTVTLRPMSSGWAARLEQGRPSVELTPTADGQSRPLEVFVRSDAGADPAEVVIDIRSKDNTAIATSFSQPLRSS